MLVTLLLLASCGDDDSAAPASATTTTAGRTSTTAATTTTLDAEAEVRAAYLAYWAMVERLSVEPNADDPEIEARTVDPLRASLIDDTRSRQAEGRTTRFPADAYSHRVDEVVVTGEAATVIDCFVDGRIEVGADGAVIDDTVATKVLTATVRRAGTTWKLSEIQTTTRTEGVSECAA